jgi:Abnormal spindle-like microcephaly-assoc'd, ASPM-SPD-2-Hydin/PQQ-like domain
MRRLVLSIFTAAALLATASGSAAVEPFEEAGLGTTNAGGDLRTGWYPNQSAISPQLVTGGTFGQLWSAPVEGQVYAQPLIDNGTLFIATEQNEIYGLQPDTGKQLWSKSLGTPWNPGDISCADLAPYIGITATPVIDPSTNVAYFTYKTYVSGDSGPARWYMDAVSVATGQTAPNFPVELSGEAQDAPTRSFAPATELQRPGLLLMNGVIYASFGSDCDTTPWDGWIFGVSTSGQVKARWVANQTEEGAGIWQSGAGLTSDGEGRILLSTGNGGAPTTPTPGKSPPANLGESVVQLQVQPDGSLKAVDFFAPFEAQYLDTWDADFASGGVTGLPDEYFGTQSIPALAVAVGKDGYVYLLNRNELGGFQQGSGGGDDVVQRIGPYGGVWSRPGVWPGEGGWIYIPTASGGESSAGSSGYLRVYQYGVSGSGTPALSLQATSEREAFGFSSSAPVITSNGTESGSALVWIVWAPSGSGAGAQLRAYYPKPVKGEPVLAWSAPVGTSAKFAIPGVGLGHLYVGTRDGHVLAFGSPVKPPLSGSATTFPPTTIGSFAEKTVTLTANESLTLKSLSSSSSQFELGTSSPPWPVTLEEGQQISVPVKFKPTATGQIGGSLTATTEESTASFGLSGAGQAATAKLEVTPPIVAFGGTSVGSKLSGGATFHNVGAAPLTIEEVIAPKAPFGMEDPPTKGKKIEPGGSITITVTFQPTANGSYQGEVGVKTSTGEEGKVGLAGSAAAPGDLKLSSEALTYGDVLLGGSASKTFTIENAGETSVEINQSKPPIGGEFSATTPLDEGTTLKPGASVTETVSFAPTVAGPTEGRWLITGDDISGHHVVVLQGSGVTSLAGELLPGGSGSLLGGGGQSTSGSGTHTSPAGAGAYSGPVLVLLSRDLHIRRSGAVPVKVHCPAGQARCKGLLVLKAQVRIAGRHHRRARLMLVVLASTSFDLAGGHTKTVTMYLSRKVLRLLGSDHARKAKAMIVASGLSAAARATQVSVEISQARG